MTNFVAVPAVMDIYKKIRAPCPGPGPKVVVVVYVCFLLISLLFFYNSVDWVIIINVPWAGYVYYYVY